MKFSATLCTLVLTLGTPALSSATGKPDATLVAGDTTSQVTLPSNGVLLLAPGTELRRERSIRLELGPGGPQPVEVFRLVRGQVDVSFPAKGPRTAVMIQAPRRLFAVGREGSFRVLTQDQSSTAAALQQSVLAAVGSDWKPLAEGRARTTGAGAPDHVHDTLQAPVPKASQPLLIAGVHHASTEVAWAAVPEARGYRVQVLNQADGTPVGRSRVTDKTHDALSLPPGSYSVVVSTVDNFGLEGQARQSDVIRVIGLRLPPGAHSDGGRIWLPARERLTLIQAEGLEMTYGKSSYFVKASSSVGLNRGQATEVTFRLPKTRTTATLALSPISVTADVTLSPRVAAWPRDTVRAEVAIRSNSKADVDVKPRVTINGKPVHVTFVRRGSVMSAVIPPGTGSGPWVVRVESVGPKGELLGRDVMDIVSSGAKRKPSGSVARR